MLGEIGRRGHYHDFTTLRDGPFLGRPGGGATSISAVQLAIYRRARASPIMSANSGEFHGVRDFDRGRNLTNVPRRGLHRRPLKIAFGMPPSAWVFERVVQGGFWYGHPWRHAADAGPTAAPGWSSDRSACRAAQCRADRDIECSGVYSSIQRHRTSKIQSCLSPDSSSTGLSAARGNKSRAWSRNSDSMRSPLSTESSYLNFNSGTRRMRMPLCASE